jgi:hypothetical protein
MAEALDVDRDGSQDVLEVGPGLPAVAAVAHVVATGELADGALDAGPDGVALVPGGVPLVSAVAGLQLVELARGKPTVRLPSPEVTRIPGDMHALAGWHLAIRVSAEQRVLGGLGGPSWVWRRTLGIRRGRPAPDCRGPEFRAWIPTTASPSRPGFDDSDDAAQVHPIARRMFPGRTPAEVYPAVGRRARCEDSRRLLELGARRAGALYPARLLHVRIQPL